ncbi:MAG TPA: BON domain-containing protein [Candidatus Acidoferrum sp.]
MYGNRSTTWSAGMDAVVVGVWIMLCVAAPVRAQSSGSRSTAPASGSAHGKVEDKAELLAREVRHQLQVLPFYSVFDNIAFTIDGSKLTLRGQVVRPTLRAAADGAVKSIEGVGRVVNEIEVLPQSPSDDELRRAIYRAIFEDPVLQKYAAQALPSIHIIVKNGNVTLEGTVESAEDKNRAASRVSGVANVAGLKDNLVLRSKQGSGQGK